MVEVVHSAYRPAKVSPGVVYTLEEGEPCERDGEKTEASNGFFSINQRSMFSAVRSHA